MGKYDDLLEAAEPRKGKYGDLISAVDSLNIGDEVSDTIPQKAPETTEPGYVPAEFQQFAEQQAIERAPYWPEQAQGAPQTLPDLMSGRYGRDVRIPENIRVPTMAETGAIPAPAIEGLIRYGTPPGWAQMAAEQIAPDDPVTKIGKGLIGGASEQLAGFTTPENLASLAVMPQAKVAQVLLNLGLGAHAVTAVPSQIKAYGETDDPEEKAKIAAGIATSIGLPALGFTHAVVSRKAPKVVEPVRTTQETANAEVLPDVQQSFPDSYIPATRVASETGGTQPLIAFAEQHRMPKNAPQLESTSIPSETARVNIQGEQEPPSASVEPTGQKEISIAYVDAAGRDSTLAAFPYDLNAAIDHIEAIGGEVHAVGGRIIGKRSAKEIATSFSEPIGVEAAEIQRRNAPSFGKTGAPAESVQTRPLESDQSHLTASAENQQVPRTEITAKPNALQETFEQQISKPIRPDIQRSPSEAVLRDERIQGRTEGEPRPETVQGTATSTQNKVTAAERESIGLPEAVEAARRDFGTVWDEAEALARSDATAPQRLVKEISENPRALTDKENALLLRRQIETQNEHSAAIEAVNAAPEDAAALSRLEMARNELQTVYDAAKNAGTETGRGLNARKMLANQDFTLAKMEAETRAVANAGRPLNSKQAAEVKGLWERINKAESKLAEYEAMGDFRKSVQAARQSRVKPFSTVTFLEERAVAAKERIMARRGKLYADPLGVTNVAHLADEAIIGAAHIARGLKNFKDWSSAMLKDFGDGIKPYLRALFAKSQGVHSEAARLSAAKSRTVTQTVKTMSRIGAKDFEPRRIESVKPDRELTALQGNLQRAKDIYFQRLVEARERNRPLHSKILRGAAKTINTSRALKTSFDVSAVGRQGGWIGAGHPLLAAKNIKPMFEAMRSVEGQYRIEQEIKAHPDYALAKQAKLELTEISDTASMTKAEEAYMNSFADKIPGVAGSQRAYVTYLNKLRMDSFGQLVKDLSKSGKVTPQEARVLANYINVATGRGYVGKWAGAFAGMNHVFFAPRYVLSRFQLLLGQPLVHNAGKASPRARALIAKEYARSLAGTATVIGLGVAAGAAFNTTDPRSTDFLKLKFGNSRLDPFYGLQQTTVFLNRVGYNILRATRHEKVPFKERDVAQRFVRSKLAPVYGSALNLGMGSDYLGRPTSPEREALQMIDPIAREDIIKAFQERGVEKGAALSALSLFGMGLQTYDRKKKAEQPKTLDEAMAELRQGKIKEFLTGR